MAWSHSLDSGRISRVFLENTGVNSFKYSRIRGDSTLELALKASASCWEMVKDALISAEGGGNRPVAKMQSLSSRDSKGTSELSWSEELEESELWSISGMGPAVQVSFHQLSALWATHWWARLTSTLRNHINCTCLFKFWAYLSTSYHYHSILTTPLTLWQPIWDKGLPKHAQLALCNYNKNSLKKLLCSQVSALSTQL